MTDILKIENFLKELCNMEYEISKQSCTLESESEYEDIYYDFLDTYTDVFAKAPFNYLDDWQGRKTDEEKKEWFEGISPRKVFLIKEYKEVIYNLNKEYKNKLSNSVFVAYVGNNGGSSSDSYKIKFYITQIEGTFKLLWYKLSTAEEKWWFSENYNLFQNMGTFVQALKIEAPKEEKHLIHYNSF